MSDGQDEESPVDQGSLGKSERDIAQSGYGFRNSGKKRLDGFERIQK